MAKIVLSPEAPDDLNSVSLANAVIEDFPFETSDPEVLGNATSHPWLTVEVTGDEEVARYRESGVDPLTDPLSAQNPRAAEALDADAVARFEDSKVEAIAPVAIDAGLNQDEVVVHGGVSVTVAADEADASRIVDPADLTDTDNAGDES